MNPRLIGTGLHHPSHIGPPNETQYPAAHHAYMTTDAQMAQ
jgi:hypothetical protein